MNVLERRIERLENRLGARPGPRLIYLAPNLEEGEGKETPYFVKLSSEVWVHVFGRPLTEEEVWKLRKEYSQGRNRNEPETED